MDILTLAIIVVILCALIFLVYYYFRGAKGDIRLSRPVESRVDEYLDRRFQSMVEEWELVSRPRLGRFRDSGMRDMDGHEARLAELKDHDTAMQATLASLEARLEALEQELAANGSAGK